jgi:hypothetical protein
VANLDDFPASFTDLPIRSEARYLQSVSTDGRPLPENSKAAPVGESVSNSNQLRIVARSAIVW